MKRFLNMWAILVSVIVLVWGASFSASAAEINKISVAYCIDCVPFQFKKDDGRAAGLIVDLWRLWSEKTGIEIDFRGAPWDETLRMVRDGKADAHAGLFFNEERNKFLEYGAPLVETNTHFFTHRDLPAIDTVEGLAGHKVGVIAGDFVEGFLKERLAPENIVRFESYEALMGALGDGELNAFAADTPTGIHHLKKSGLYEKFNFPADKPLYRNGWLVAARKGNTELISAIDGGMGLIEVRERRQISRLWGAGSVEKSASPDPWEIVGDVLTKEEVRWLTEHPVIRLTPDPAFPPIEFFDSDGKFRGIGAEVTRLIEEKLRIRFKIIRVKDWAEATERTKNRENDVWSIVARTPEREKYMLFTEPYVESPLVIVVRKQNEKDLKPEDLRGMKVTYVTDYSGGYWITRNYPDYDYVPAPDTQTGLKMVSFGIADAMVVSVALASHYIEEEGITNLRVAGKTGHVLRWGFASRSDWPILNGILKKGLAQVTPEELRAIHRKWVFLEASWTPTRQHVIIGLMVLGVLIVVGVITWNRALQRQIERRTAAQAQAEARLMDAIENVSEGFALFDADKRIMLCNSQYKEIYGYDEVDTAPGTTLADLTQLDFERGVLAKELDGEETVRRRTEIYGETQETFDVPMADGRWVQIRDRPTSDGGTVSMHADITERKKAEAAMRAAKEEADRANQAKSDLVAMVSHEVRTPMNGVLGMARLLQELDLDNEQRECADTIVASGESLLHIVDDLLDVSKLEAGRLELESAPFIASDVVEQSVALMASRADEKGLMLTYKIDPNIPAVLTGDPHRLRQVMLNLISNAIKFTAKGSVTAKAALKSEKGGFAVVGFSVTDTGQGIKPENRKKLFLPYSQGAIDVARKYGGTGLGLTICRRLVKLMDSEIKLRSTVGKGSSFHFDVSFAIDRKTDAADLREATAMPAAMARDKIASVRPLNILQVEDNEINRDVAEKILTRAGHRVTSVGNGAEALEVIRTGGFDIVLMDRDMPKMDGIKATRLIRAMDGPVAAIPIVGITASAIQAQLDDCLDAGMNACLTKPVDSIELRDTLEGLAGGGLTVLIIDDTEISRNVAAKQLAKLSIACEAAESGAQGLKMAEDKEYGAILVDISMPEMDGMEFTERFRQSERAGGRRTPVIAMTGHKSPEDRKRFLAAGMDDVLTKPVAIKVLAAALKIHQPGAAPGKDGGGSASGPVQPPIDLNQLSEILGEEDMGELFSMLDMFTDTFPGLLIRLRDAVAAYDAKSVHDRAHAAKSAATSAAAVPLSKLLQTLENDADKEDWADIADQAEAIEFEYARITAFCRENMKQA